MLMIFGLVRDGSEKKKITEVDNFYQLISYLARVLHFSAYGSYGSTYGFVEYTGIHIPTGGSAHSITVSARSVSPILSSQYIIFLAFLSALLSL